MTKPKAEDYMLANGVPLLSKKKHQFQGGRAATGKAVGVELTRWAGDNSLIGQADIESGVLARVQVYSVLKPGMIKQCEKKFYKVDSTENIAKWCEISSGAMAEACCETFGDVFDPSDYAKAGREAFRKVLRELEQDDRLTRVVVKS